MRPTILIVEDDPAVLHVLARTLEHAGYDVVTVGTYAAGRAALQARSPDVLLVDIRLGDFNGLQLVATRPRAIPTIVMTGYPDVVLEREARRFGAEYLVKPIAAEVLLAAIRRQRDNEPVARPQRRWPRKQLAVELPIWINEWPGRLIDVSYGGARLEVDDRVDDVPPDIDVSVPASNVRLSAHVVWKASRGEARCVCGTELVIHDTAQADRWRRFVGESLGA